MEFWKDIKGYRGYYQISNLGRIRSCDRDISDINKTQHIKGKIIKPTNNGNGYLIVSLRINGKRKNHYVHRLVAESFIDNLENKPEVNHKDFNPYNNCVNNLEWSTRKENILYSNVNGRYDNARKLLGARNVDDALKKSIIYEKEILKRFDNGESITNISTTLHMEDRYVKKIILKYRKKYILCVETNEKFRFIKDANLKYGVTTVKDAISGRQKTAAGYHWKSVIECLIN